MPSRLFTLAPPFTALLTSYPECDKSALAYLKPYTFAAVLPQGQALSAH